MSHPILRLNDGFDHTSPELRDEVKVLQTEFNQEGFALEADGLFGRDTESAAPGAAVAGHPGHGRALAPRHRPPPLGRQIHARQERPACDPPQH